MSKGVSNDNTNDTNNTNSVEDYLDVAIRPQTEFVKVQEVYDHFIPVIRDDGSIGANLVYRLIAAKLGVNFPSFLIYVPENGFNPLSRDIVVEKVPDDQLMELRIPTNSPREPFKKTLIAIAYENDFRLPKRKKDEEEPAVQEIWWRILDDQLTKVNPFILRRGHQIVDDELRKVLSWNWPKYVDDLLYMGASKDSRLTETGKTYLMPQFHEMRRMNSLGIWMTNPYTGKSILAEKLGTIIIRTTQKSVTGGSKADGSVVPSFLMSHRRLITVEQLEAVEVEALLAYMLTSLSGVESHVVVWQTPQLFSPYCPLLVTGNPNRERGQPNFEVFFNYIQGISKNYVALGRRVSIILYGNDYAPCEPRESLEVGSHYENLWIIWREVSTRILPLYRELYRDGRVQTWLHTPDPEYESSVRSVFGEEGMMIREFFLDHAKNGHPALKYRALSGAVAQNAQELLRISLGERNKEETWNDIVNEVLEESKQNYSQLKTVNLQSIRQIAETEKLDIKILMDIQKGLPRYMGELLVTIAHYTSTLEDETVFAVDMLRETFDTIKNELGFFPGISTIKQALNGKRYNPRKYLDRISNFGFSLRRKSDTDLWIVTLRDPRKLKKWLEAVNTLSTVSTGYTLILQKGLIEALEEKTERGRIEGKLPPGVYNEAVETATFWFRDHHNRDPEGWALVDELLKIISTAAEGRIGVASDILRQMVAEGLLEHHDRMRGRVRLCRRRSHPSYTTSENRKEEE